MLEQQSTLISSLANVTQQNRGHQNDHLIPLLEGQQAVLDKLSTVEGAQSEVTDLLVRFDEQQSEVVGDLRSELAEIKAEKAELVERLHRLEVELLETRQETARSEKETSEIRDRLDMAQNRNAALELHLQTLIKDKDSVAREYEQDQKTRERDQLSHKKTLVDLHAKAEELIGEKRRNEVLAETIRSQSSELVELRRSTSKFHETLVDRLSRIEEGVQGSTVNSAEYVKLQDRNEHLQGEIDKLKAKVSLPNPRS
jgi:DNA repair exonuclease SbcCD ATPase subunit